MPDPTSVQHPPVPGVEGEGHTHPDGTITDPLTYHRIRVNEALGFAGLPGHGATTDAIRCLGDTAAYLEATTNPDRGIALRNIRQVLGQLYAVRDLCADGDRT